MSKIQTPHEFKCDLDVGSLEVKLREPLMHQDSLADVFRVRVLRNGKELSLSGMVARGFMYSEVTRKTIPLPGVVEGSFVSVTLIDKCYAVPGEATLSIQVQEGDVCHTLANIHFDLRRTGTNVVTDPAGVLPTLPVLLAKITALEQTTNEARQTISDVKAEGDEAVEQTMAAAADARLAAQEITGSSASPIRKSATGKFIELDNAADKPLRGLKLYGRTEQVKTTGKNILPNGGNEKSGDMVFYDVSTAFAGLEGQQINVSFELYSPNGSQVSIYAYQQSGLSISNGYDFIPTAGTYKRYSFSTSVIQYSQTLNAGTIIFYSPSGSANIVKNVQIELGSVATTYEPYTGGVPSPSPNYPQPLVSPGDSGSIEVIGQGKNLLALTKLVNPVANDATLTISDNEINICPTRSGISFQQWYGFFNVSESLRGRTLTLSIGSFTNENTSATQPAAFVVQRDAANADISSSNLWNLPGSISFKILDNAVRFYVLFRADQAKNAAIGKNVRFGKIQLELGSAATAFEPYKDGGSLTASTPNGLPGIPVSSGGNYTDSTGQQWICDEKDYERGVYVQRIIRRTLNGTESWVANNEADNKYTYFLHVHDVGASECLCDKLTAAYSYELNARDNIAAVTPEYNGVIYLRASGYMTEDTPSALKAMLAQYTPTVMYALATPIETPIPADEMSAYRAMMSQYPHTTVYSDSDVEMTVDYIGETERFVHEVIDDRAAPPIVETASGSVVSITDGANRPAVDLISHIEPLQSGSGDASPNNVRPISGWNSVTAQRTGKNLLPEFVSGYWEVEGVATVVEHANWMRSPDLIAIKPNTTYTLSRSDGVTPPINGYICLYDKNKMSVRYFQDQTFTTNESEVYFAAYTQTGYYSPLQLESSPVPTAYEPYQCKTLSATLPETVYGGKLDWKTGVLTVGMYKKSASDFPTIVCDVNADGVRYADLLHNGVHRSKQYGDCVSNVYKSLPSGTTYSGAMRLFTNEITVYDERFTNEDVARALLEEMGFEVVYELEEPYTIQLTPQQLSTLHGNNNVWSNCGSTELSYVADTKSYIDKKLAAIAATLI